MTNISAESQDNQTQVILKDGSSIQLRPIFPNDVDSCHRLVQRASDQSKFLRFGHSPEPMGTEGNQWFCTVDYKTTFALVAEILNDGVKDIVAIGRYYRLPHKNSAEVYVLVDESYQGRGLGTVVMEKLAATARTQDISVFEADVQVENESALSLISSFGFHVTKILDNNVYHTNMPIMPTRTSIRQEEERERLATVASVKSIFYPRSIAIIGASRHTDAIGYLLVRSLVESGFSGAVYPVNPNTEVISSIKAYPSVSAIPGDVDMAIIAVPATLVSRVVQECGRKKVRSLIVISDGFKESGPEGAVRERELREIAFGLGMRIVGPNCMGAINTDTAVSMNATFSSIYPSAGNVSFLSQSGAMGVVILEYARSLNFGLATFISIGNRADISPNDLLQYWEQDPRTKVILLYMESFGNPRNFVRIVRRVSAKKPIVVVKSGSTSVGSRAASSHTGAMATSEVVTEALFRQTGIIRVRGVEELFDVATLLSNQPLPKGKRLVIVTNGGGPGILAADASVEQGLQLPEISEETKAKIKTHLTRNIRINNPVDTTAQATTEEFEGILRVLADDKGNDAVMLIFVPPSMSGYEGIEAALRRVSPLFRRNHKPLIVCFMGQKGFNTKLGSPGKYIPSYLFPESAIYALAKAASYGDQQFNHPKGIIPKISGLHRTKAKEIISEAMKQSIQRPLWLSASQIASLLNCYGINYASTETAKTAEEAEEAAERIGFPVTVKLSSPTITHKTDVGGVVLNLNSREEVGKAFNDIKNRLTKMQRENEMEGVIIQRMVSGGIETIMGVSHDPSFGPMIMFGMGGVNAELINDVVFRLAPLTDIDARELVKSIKTAKLFEGYRGSPPTDTIALEGLLLRLSAMIDDLPQITELDFNPVKALPKGQGYCIVDARIAVS
jgi:acetyl coenzyme A synthetase (ADP forming)-like protein